MVAPEYPKPFYNLMMESRQSRHEFINILSINIKLIFIIFVSLVCENLIQVCKHFEHLFYEFPFLATSDVNNNNKSSDSSKATLSEGFADLSVHHLDDSRDSGFSNNSQRHAPQQPFGGFQTYYYCENPWTDPVAFDPNGDHPRMGVSGGYALPPRSDRLRNLYENHPTSAPAYPTGTIYSELEASGNAASTGIHAALDASGHFYGGVHSAMIPVKRRDLLEQTFSVNLEASPSYDSRGHDIAVNDPGTLRFFYNLGHEYFGQLRLRYGMAALAQLAHNTDKPDTLDAGNPGHFYHDAFGHQQQQQQEQDNVTHKMSHFKLGGKGAMQSKNDSATNQQRRQGGGFNGGHGKMSHTKRYSNRNQVATECDSSVTTNESESKGSQHGKDSTDGTVSGDGGSHPLIQQPLMSFDPFHTPHRYSGHQTEHHAQPLLRTPVPMDSNSSVHTGTAALPDMSPMAPFIPMAAGHAYPQYIPVFPMDDQQVCCRIILNRMEENVIHAIPMTL